MKSSARNQFAGPIGDMKMGPVNCEVSIHLDDDLELTAIITRESAENLELAVGKEVQAIVKSSSVLLMMDNELRVSARNRYCGEVIRIHDGPVNAEVTLSLTGGRHVVTSVITHESLKKLDIKEGSQVCAAFKASSVILAVAG